MKIVLDHDEIMDALTKAVEMKTNQLFGEANRDDCIFVVCDDNGHELDFVSATFTWEIKND